MMTKKHFIALADALRGAELPPAVVDRLLVFMRSQNSQFKPDRWLDYLHGKCGPGGGEIKPRSLGPCSCRRGIERDNCAACEGTGKRIDFAAIRAKGVTHA